MNIRSQHTGISSRIQMVRNMFTLLSERQRYKYRLFVVWMFCGSLVEIFTFGIFVSFLKIITAPELLSTTSWGNALQRIAGFSSLSDSILLFGGIIVTTFLFKNWVTYTMYASFNQFVFGIAAELSQTKLREYYSLDFLEVEKRNTSEYARQTMHVPIEFSQHVVLGSMIILSESMVMVMLTITVILLNTMAFLLIIGFLLPFIAATRYISVRKLRTGKKTIHSLNDKNAKVLSDILNGYVDARLYRKEEYFTNRYSKMQETLNKELATLNSVNTLPGRLSEVFLISALVVILFISHGSMKDHTTGIAAVTAVFVAFLYRVVPSVNKILTMWSNVQTYSPTITMLQPFRTLNPPEPVQAAQVSPIKFRTALEFNNISFGYEGRETKLLNNVSMKICKGDVVGIVGKSGSGKTTLLHLLLRLLNIQSGTIIMDGSPAANASITSWQFLFAYVKQNPFLLHDTIEANVAFGENPADIDQEKISKTMTLVGLKVFLASLPDGLLTNIGERGKQLSGGQKQRLVIARALYRNAEIFIFDEATSELDSASENEIVDTMESLHKNGKTIIIASHRQSALVHCNFIYELNNGRLYRRTMRAQTLTRKKK
jgi:ATP-binding cassette, subfamily B, bacterial PglK